MWTDEIQTDLVQMVIVQISLILHCGRIYMAFFHEDEYQPDICVVERTIAHLTMTILQNP
jgi:hypothetical protein